MVSSVVSFRSECFSSNDPNGNSGHRKMLDMKDEIGECLLQMQGHSFTSVGISASQEEMAEVNNCGH